MWLAVSASWTANRNTCLQLFLAQLQDCTMTYRWEHILDMAMNPNQPILRQLVNLITHYRKVMIAGAHTWLLQSWMVLAGIANALEQSDVQAVCVRSIGHGT